MMHVRPHDSPTHAVMSTGFAKKLAAHGCTWGSSRGGTEQVSDDRAKSEGALPEPQLAGDRAQGVQVGADGVLLQGVQQHSTYEV
jgi:hypothetical protein